MKDLAIVFHDNPKRLSFSIPSIVPDKLCVNLKRHFEDGAGDGL